ncbi:hypothetical protein ACFFMN_13540 [Planobispora siamensis]|uniref:TPM domain-containing protein n=1 Tax=Planobispora siamensis TaxID=936338 RepID=A0A8J3SBM3_9ACTN|nr:hypothetical protein [Planobispora siamensis]GIH89616.1 hypothetical protein Psi01_02460 [Planobispora siamensis]
MTTKQTMPGRLGAAIIATFAGLLAIFMLAPAANAAAPDPGPIASDLQSGDRFYYDSATGAPEGAVDAMRSAVGEASNVYLAVLPSGSIKNSSEASTFLKSLNDQIGGDNVVVVVNGSDQLLYRPSVPGWKRELDRAYRQASRAPNMTEGTATFVRLADDVANGRSVSDPGSRSSGGSSVGVLVGILVLALAGGAGLFLYSRKKKKDRLAREAAELAAVKQTVDEDVTKLGEEITDLDMDVKMLADGGDHQEDWTRALDAYERAKAELTAAKQPDDLRNVTTALEEGRYALACVRARVNKEPLPERRPPCFFNPQHGPSARDVRWAPPGGAVRDVPACAADAEAVERGFEPQSRQVMVNGQSRPYYEAGPAYQPYAYGYYGGFGDVMTGMLVGTMLGSMMGGWGMGGYGMGYGAGYEEGLSDAGGDMGGGDFGGGGWGDFGGGDFGGGDFGGGDW